MDIVGFSQDEKQSLYTLLSAILNIGNVTFEAVFDKSSGHNIHDSVDLKNEKCKLSRNCVPIKLVVLSEYGYFVEKTLYRHNSCSYFSCKLQFDWISKRVTHVLGP